MNLLFLLNSAALGVGLAMDAFSVSIANGLRELDMPGRRMCLMAGVYALFQYAMPLLGWLCVHTIIELFSAFAKLTPWIALALLLYLGAGLLREGFSERNSPEEASGKRRVSLRELLVQGVATSIDALSVGFTLAEYDFPMANLAGVIIAGVTFVICLGGLAVSKRVGNRLSWRASVLGGCILIAIGIEIFVKGVLI